MSYSEALEKQVSLLRWARSQYASEMAQQLFGSKTWFDTARNMLPAAEPFYVSRAISELLVKTSPGLPDLVPTITMVPGSYGFVWFEKPVELAPIKDHMRLLHALQWGVGLKGSSDGAPSGWENVPPDDLSSEHVELLIVPWCSLAGSSMAHPIPWMFCEWFFDETQSQAAARELMQRSTKKRPLEEEATLKTYNLFASLCLFMQQRILVHSQQQADRSTRRRLERSGWDYQPLIRVVELRRKERIGDKQPVESIEREWSCQWVVRGHWRQQFYPSKHQNVPIWITPYVKGPEDKPLKPPRATVFAVIR